MVIMEIRYSTDIVLQVNITPQMIGDWRECRRQVKLAEGCPDCPNCSLNINLDEDGSLGICEVGKVRKELYRLAGLLDED